MEPGLEPSDERLVLFAKDGNLDAFNSLVDRYQAAVYNLCARLLGNREAAEDAAQEAFLSAYHALSRFEGGSFRSWLLRIAANESKDELRRRKRKDAVSSLEEIFDRSESPVEVPDHREGADILFERKEFREMLESAVQQLPFEQRQAVLLVDLYEFQYEEVAQMTGASLGTIKSRIHRGRERLRKVLLARPELLAGWRRLEE
ncbi:MAG: sigma-70 family RNA polymerase sigma factor [Chloroflexi bacterium]|nr:sigma-70 family RNA polymerase sigma factor [Chloroflexota bacterium]